MNLAELCFVRLELLLIIININIFLSNSGIPNLSQLTTYLTQTTTPQEYFLYQPNTQQSSI